MHKIKLSSFIDGTSSRNALKIKLLRHTSSNEKSYWIFQIVKILLNGEKGVAKRLSKITEGVKTVTKKGEGS